MTEDGQYIGDRTTSARPRISPSGWSRKGCRPTRRTARPTRRPIISNGKLAAFSARRLVGAARPEERGAEDEGTLAGGSGSWWRRQPRRFLPGDHEVLQEPRGRLRLHQLAGVGEEPGPVLPRPGALPVHPGLLHRSQADVPRTRSSAVSGSSTSSPSPPRSTRAPTSARTTRSSTRRSAPSWSTSRSAARRPTRRGTTPSTRSTANSPERGRSEMAVSERSAVRRGGHRGHGAGEAAEPVPAGLPAVRRDLAVLHPVRDLRRVPDPVLDLAVVPLLGRHRHDEVGRPRAVQLPAQRSDVLEDDRQHHDHLGALDRPDAAAGAGDRERAAQRDPVPQLLPDRVLHPERHLGGRGDDGLRLDLQQQLRSAERVPAVDRARTRSSG